MDLSQIEIETEQEEVSFNVKLEKTRMCICAKNWHKPAPRARTFL